MFTFHSNFIYIILLDLDLFIMGAHWVILEHDDEP